MYLKYFIMIPSTKIGIRYFLIFQLPTESLCLSRFVACLRALGTSRKMLSGNRSVH